MEKTALLNPPTNDALAKLLLALGETLQQNRADIQELQRDVSQLSTTMQLLAQEVRQTRETDAAERAKMALQFQNELLKLEKLLSSQKQNETQ